MLMNMFCLNFKYGMTGGPGDDWPWCKNRVQAKHGGRPTQEEARHHEGERSFGMGAKSGTSERIADDGVGF